MRPRCRTAAAARTRKLLMTRASPLSARFLIVFEAPRPPRSLPARLRLGGAVDTDDELGLALERIGHDVEIDRGGRPIEHAPGEIEARAVTGAAPSAGPV